MAGRHLCSNNLNRFDCIQIKLKSNQILPLSAQIKSNLSLIWFDLIHSERWWTSILFDIDAQAKDVEV
jgi:hypothetical protein